MKDYKTKFLESSVLGQRTNKNNSDSVLCKCVDLAYNDMMSVGRYYSSGFQNSRDYICSGTIKIIEKYNYEFSRQIISEVSFLFGENEIIGNGNKYVTRYGLAQKIVNMTFKYMYVFSDYIFANSILPDFSKCDCPLDSIILGKANLKQFVWSKIDSDSYVFCQNYIEKYLKLKTIDSELSKIGNLAFDFLNW